MFGGCLSRFRGAQPVQSNRLPLELISAIDAAAITFRPSHDPEDGSPRIYVRVASVGSWRFDGIAEAADKIHVAWPELNRPMAEHAAQLLAGVVAKRNREEVRGQPRRSWVFDW